MVTNLLFFDMMPIAAGVGAIAAIGFFLVCVAIAFTAFLLLRKTLKMAFRIGIVVVILAIAVCGAVALLWLGVAASSSSHPQRPVNVRQR